MEESGEQEDKGKPEICTTERKVLSQRGHLGCHWEKAEGTDKTSVTHTQPSLLAGGFPASRKSELHLTDHSIVMTISALLALLWLRRENSPGGGSRSKGQHEAVGGQPGTGTGWEGAEGGTGTPAPGESLYTAGNTHTPPSLPFSLKLPPSFPCSAFAFLSLYLAQKLPDRNKLTARDNAEHCARALTGLLPFLHISLSISLKPML